MLPNAGLMGLGRRRFLEEAAVVTASTLIATAQTPSNANGRPQSRFNDLLRELQSDETLANSFQARDELAEAFASGLERAPIRTPKSSAVISSQASDLIVACEVSSKSAYTQHYQGPVWPKGKSGVTIGIGYDLGFVTPADLAEDWSDYIAKSYIIDLSPGCGVTGTAAGELLKQFATIHVSWEVALAQYSEQTRPRYVGTTEAALLNTTLLSPDRLGALVSLVYNRGPAFALAGDRYREMRNIKAQMSLKEFQKIPQEIRSMKRLWDGQPEMRGLLLRRDVEASLFGSSEEFVGGFRLR